MNSKYSSILRCAALVVSLCSSHCSQSANGASDLGIGDLGAADLGAADLVALPPGPGLTAVTPSLIPMAAGIPLVIDGANFAAGATVTIAGVPATLTEVVSDTRITTVTPNAPLSMTSVPVVVTNPNGQTVSRSDLLTYYSLTVATAKQPVDIAVGDFDGDGNADFVTANKEGQSVSIRFGDGRASFPRRLDLPLSIPGSGLAVTDYNRDGMADITVSSVDITRLVNIDLILGARAGSLKMTSIGQFPNGAAFGPPVTGDWNQDGQMDLAFPFAGGGLATWLGDGTGKFAPTTGCTQAGGVPWLVSGDLNGDGLADLVTEDAYVLRSCIGDGAGKFTKSGKPGIYVDNCGLAVSAHMLDLNGDHKDDLILVGGGHVSISFNDGMGGLLSPVTIPVSGTATKLAVADVNGN